MNFLLIPKRTPALLICFALARLAFLNASAVEAPQRRSLDLSTASGQSWQFKAEGNNEWDRIIVPGGGWRMQGHGCDEGTYKTIVTIPSAAAGSIVRLAFDAVNFGAEVTAGSDETHQKPLASHVDGWLPFSADLTGLAQPGEKLCVLVCVKGRKKFMENGKYLVPEAATWADFLAEGILRGVRLEIVPPVRIEDADIRTSVSRHEFAATITVVNDTGGPQVICIDPRFEKSGNWQYPAIHAAEVEVAPHSRADVVLGPVAWPLGRESFWWPNVPYNEGYRPVQHRLALDLMMGGRRIDSLSRRFGFREFRAEGAHWELNGVRCNLRGGNQQEANFGPDAYGTLPGFAAPSAGCGGWPEAVRNLLRLNFNTIRIHQVPATPYMLDVCDEEGLMIVDETPIRGSEGAEDYDKGRDNMLTAAREQGLRDRLHPSVVLWSAANEIGHDAIAHALQETVLAVDSTRPVIFDGCKDFGAPLINTEHYVGGIGSFPEKGARERGDRPYGETEAIWPVDNGPRGFTWMSTATRIRRLKNNADIRDYILNNVWPNYVPGTRPETMFLESKVKKMNWGTGWNIMPAISDPWHHRQIQLLQRCFHPLAAWDVEYGEANEKSNASGEYPATVVVLPPGKRVERKLVFFNDTFNAESPLQVNWTCVTASRGGLPMVSGTLSVPVGCGCHEFRTISFDTPGQPGFLWLKLAVKLNGATFSDESTCFAILPQP